MRVGHIIDERESCVHRVSEPVEVRVERLVYAGPEQLLLVYPDHAEGVRDVDRRSGDVSWPSGPASTST